MCARREINVIASGGECAFLKERLYLYNTKLKGYLIKIRNIRPARYCDSNGNYRSTIANTTRVLAAVTRLRLSWLAEVHQFTVSSNTRLLDDKTRNRVMLGNVIITL